MQRWTVLFGCFIGMGISISATLAFPFGLYLDAVTSEFGWSRAQFSATLSIISLGNLIMLPVAGWAVDRIGAVRSILIGLVLANAFCAGIALTHSFIGFAALSCLASMCGQLALYPAYFSIVRGWFDKNLGVALAIATAGISVGVGGFSRLITQMIASHGWRSAFVTSAGVAFLVGAAALLLLIRENKALFPVQERRSDSTETVATGLPLGPALQSVDFWLFAVAFLLIVFAGSGPQVHLPALLADKGVVPGVIASVMGTLALGSVIGRLAAGFLLDRISFRWVAALFFIGQAAGIKLLAWNPHLAVIAALLMGGALGAEADLMGFVLARRFGRLAYARILGVALAVAQSALLLSPVGTGLIFDQYKSYDLVLTVYPFLSLAAVALILFAKLSRNDHALPAGSPNADRDTSLGSAPSS